MTLLPEPKPEDAHHPDAKLPEEVKKATTRRTVGGTRSLGDAQKRIAELRKREKTLNAAVRAKVAIGPLKLNVDTYEALITLAERTNTKPNACAVVLIEEALEQYLTTDRVPVEFGVDQTTHQRPGHEFAKLGPTGEGFRPAITAREGERSPWEPQRQPQTVFQTNNPPPEIEE